MGLYAQVFGVVLKMICSMNVMINVVCVVSKLDVDVIFVLLGICAVRLSGSEVGL